MTNRFYKMGAAVYLAMAISGCQAVPATIGPLGQSGDVDHEAVAHIRG